MPLPLELVLNIVTCTLPSPGAILDSSHPITKTLVSFTLVCRETRRLASRYLLQHCAYLNSSTQLCSFLLQVPTRPDLRAITRLSLAPFQNSIDDLPICLWVRELFNYTCDSLRKLVIDMPLQTCLPEDDHLAVRRVLREGFERLIHLEEFASTRYDLYLDETNGEHEIVWKKWPKLKQLALWYADVDLDAEFWRHVAKHPSLETIVLPSPGRHDSINYKAQYFTYADRPIKVVFCAPTGWCSEEAEFPVEDWDDYDPEGKMKIVEHTMPDVGQKDRMNLYQRHFRASVEDGTLWNWEGVCLEYPTQMSIVDWEFMKVRERSIM